MSFDTREGASCCLRAPNQQVFSRMPSPLGLAERMPPARQVCAWRAIKQVEAGLEGGGVPGMCGRHSKDQCTPADTGGVERVTEVDAERRPIPSLCIGRGDPCGAA